MWYDGSALLCVCVYFNDLVWVDPDTDLSVARRQRARSVSLVSVSANPLEVSTDVEQWTIDRADDDQLLGALGDPGME